MAELVQQPRHWHPVPFLSNAVLNPAEERGIERGGNF